MRLFYFLKYILYFSSGCGIMFAEVKCEVVNMALTITQRIYKNSHLFSKGQKKLAAAVTYQYDKIVYMTAAQLGNFVGVSESTVVRFAALLGYEGYGDFQKAIAELVRSKLTPNQRIDITKKRIGRGDVAELVMSSDIEKIRYSLENLNKVEFFNAVDTILSARTLYITGARNSEQLARLLHYNLSLIFDNVKLVVPTSTAEVFEQMFSIGEQDAIFTISFPRYSTKVVNAAKFAKSKNAKVIVLTDTDTSPLIEFADSFLTAQSDMASFMDSLVAPLSIINAMIVEITRQREKEIKERFDTLEKLWDEYDVYTNK